MIEIRDQQLRLLFLTHLVRELQRSAAEGAPAPQGLDGRQLEELRSLSTDDLVRLSELPSPRVAIQIDAGSFEHGLRQVGYLAKRTRQIEYFVRHGATRTLLRELFGVSRQRVAEIRRAQRLRSAQGRPKLPPRKGRDVIEAAWTRLARAFKDTRSRLHELHREFPQYSFAALDAVVRQSASLAPDLSKPPGKRRRGEPVSPELERASTRAATPRVPIVHRRDPE